jgi:D-glycerate 3-kinase
VCLSFFPTLFTAASTAAALLLLLLLLQWVFGWRLQAEQCMRAAGKPGMTDEQIADFVSRYMPAYKAYLPGLYAAGPTTAKAGHTLIIEVDQSRSPVAQQPKPLPLK